MALKKTEVIKHSAAIQMTNRINLLQRRAWNILLAEAFDDLLIEDRHKVKIKDLASGLNFDSKNVQHLKDLLMGLMTTSVQWNILGKAKNQVWEAYPLIGGAKIERGELTYEFAKGLKEKLFNPSMYARISLSIQNKFTSKHSLALYELCVDYFDLNRNQGETAWIDLDLFKSLMGINGREYKNFKSLNRRLIKEPLKEINESSDLYVEVDYKKQQRKVVEIKFRIKRNPNKRNLIDIGKDVVKELPAGPVNQALYERLRKYFLFNNKQALETLKEHDEDYIKEILNEIEKRIIEDNIQLRNITVYTLKALKEDWRTRKTQFELDLEQRREEEKRVEEEKIRQEKEKEFIKDKELKEELEHFDKIFAGLSKAKMKYIYDEVEKSLERDNRFVFDIYQKGKKKGQSLDDMPLVKASFLELRNNILKNKYIDKSPG